MIEECHQILLAYFGESWPSSAVPRRIVSPPNGSGCGSSVAGIGQRDSCLRFGNFNAGEIERSGASLTEIPRGHVELRAKSHSGKELL